jgi:exodeoxyribonuclease VII small subunit
MADKKELSFEQAMSRLEQIVKLLEKGDAPLEDSLSLFEEGQPLQKGATSILKRPKRR